MFKSILLRFVDLLSARDTETSSDVWVNYSALPPDIEMIQGRGSELTRTTAVARSPPQSPALRVVAVHVVRATPVRIQPHCRTEDLLSFSPQNLQFHVLVAPFPHIDFYAFTFQ